MTRKRTKATQAELAFPKGRGGARKGAGRKGSGERREVSHVKRSPFSKRRPVFITTRLCAGLPSLRSDDEGNVIFNAMMRNKLSSGFRIVEFSVQHNHLHLIAEADSRKELSCAMRELNRQIADGLNELWNREGGIFDGRYHERFLSSPPEAANVLLYVLNNARRHGEFLRPQLPDPYSSGRWFEGWANFEACSRDEGSSPVATAKTWLLRVGWKREASLFTDMRPGRKRSVREGGSFGDVAGLRGTQLKVTSRERAL